MGKFIAIIVTVIVLVLVLFFACTPSGKATWNTWWHGVQVADDNTNYETLKTVEDTCRSYIASYTSDKLIYEQNKDSADEGMRMYAENAKIRANKTASVYNNYILKNEYVWRGNVPNDIARTLPYID